MKVLLTAVDSKFIHSNLAVRYLKNFTKDLDYEGKIKEFTINDREGRILEEIILEEVRGMHYKANEIVHSNEKRLLMSYGGNCISV